MAFVHAIIKHTLVFYLYRWFSQSPNLSAFHTVFENHIKRPLNFRAKIDTLELAILERNSNVWNIIDTFRKKFIFFCHEKLAKIFLMIFPQGSFQVCGHDKPNEAPTTFMIAFMLLSSWMLYWLLNVWWHVNLKRGAFLHERHFFLKSK